MNPWWWLGLAVAFIGLALTVALRIRQARMTLPSQPHQLVRHCADRANVNLIGAAACAFGSAGATTMAVAVPSIASVLIGFCAFGQLVLAYLFLRLRRELQRDGQRLEDALVAEALARMEDGEL